MAIVGRSPSPKTLKPLPTSGRCGKPNWRGDGVIKTLWAMVQGDPVFMRRINGWLTIFWIIMIPISVITGWVHSVVYVSALSLWALVSGHWAAWQASRVEVKQDQETS